MKIKRIDHRTGRLTAVPGGFRSYSQERRSMQHSNVWWFVVLSAMFVSAGCGGGEEVPEGQEAVYPVTGSVTYNGQPVADATISLHSEGKPGSFARTDSDGNFSVNTYAEGDGAPAGTYTLTVTKMVDVNAGEASDAIDAVRAPAKYESQVPEYLSKKESSGLKVTIEPEKTTVLKVTLADEEGGTKVEQTTD